MSYGPRHRQDSPAGMHPPVVISSGAIEQVEESVKAANLRDDGTFGGDFVAMNEHQRQRTNRMQNCRSFIEEPYWNHMNSMGRQQRRARSRDRIEKRMSHGVSSNWQRSEVSLLDKTYHSTATRSTCESTRYTTAISRGDALPDDQRSGRMTRWLALATVNVVATSSIANATTAAQRGARESVALASASLAFAICTIVGVGRVHEPFRQRINERPDYGSLMPLTWEQAAALAVLILVCVMSAIVLDTRASVSGVPLAVEGVAVWNSNLFCASWIGMYGAAYLVSCVFGHEVFIRNRFGPSSNQLWFLSFFSSLALASLLFSLMSSVKCGQEYLRGSPYCERTLTTAILALGGSIVSLTCGLCFLIKRSSSLRQTPLIKRICLLATAVQFTLFSSIVGLASSSPGPAVEFGSVFVASWAAWIIAFISFKTSIENLFTEEEDIKIMRTRVVKSLDKSSRSCDHTVRMTDDETAFDESSYGELDESVGELSNFVRGLDSLAIAHQNPYEYTGQPALPDPLQELLSDAESCHRGYEPEDHEDPGYNASYGRSDPDGSSYSPKLLARTSTSTGTTGTSSSSSNPTSSSQSSKRHDHEENSFYTTDGGSYFSGSQAVNVRTGIQEDVSTLGGTTMDRDPLRFGDLSRGIRDSHTTASTFGVHKQEPFKSSESPQNIHRAKDSMSDSRSPQQPAVKDAPANFSNNSRANPKMRRRMSSETFITNLSPLQERSCEESGSPSTGCKKSPATRSSRSTKTSKSPRVRTSRSRKSTHVTQKRSKISNESSIRATVDKKLKKGRDKQAKKDRAAAMAAASNRNSGTPPTASTSSSSSSDFDILIHSDNSELTELTQEGFGPPSAARATGKTAYIPRSGFVSMDRRLPQRLPLYNGSDTSSSAKSSKDAFPASAMEYANKSRDQGNLQGFQGSPTTADDDESTDRGNQIRSQRRRRRSGGVSSSDSSGGNRNSHGIARKKSPAGVKSRSQTQSKSSGRSRGSRKSRSSNSLHDSISFAGTKSDSSRRPSLLSMFSEENTLQIPADQDFAC